MAEFIPLGSSSAMWGGALGNALGSGVGHALQQRLEEAAQERLERLAEGQRSKKRSTFEKLGFSPEQADFLIGLTPKEQWQAAQILGQQQLQGQQGIPQAVGAKAPPTGLSTLQGAPMAKEQQQIAQILQGLGNAQQNQQGQQALMSLLNAAQQKELLKQQSFGTPEMAAPSLEQRLAQQPRTPVKEPVQPQPARPVRAETEGLPIQGQAALFGVTGGLTPAQQLQREKFEQAKEETLNRVTEPFYAKTKEAAEGAKEADVRLDRMRELINNGDLPYAGTAAIVDTLAHAIPIPFTGKHIGVNLKPFIYSADAQEFDKLSKDFIKNVKQFVGTSQITQGEIQLFLDTVPTLLQSDEGKKAVIRNMKIMNKIALAKNDAMENIIDEHGGKRPRDL